MRQRGFCDGTLKPLMDKAADGRAALLFLDASHFVMGCDYLGFIYGKVRRFAKSFSGRIRYNVLGAVDFVTKEVVTVTNDTYITATEVCEILRKISARYTGRASIWCLTMQGIRNVKQSRGLPANYALTSSAYRRTALTST